MSPTAPTLLIIDPLTLKGRELLLFIEREPHLVGEVSFCHTTDDEEQQIAEFSGQPSLVPPLDPTTDLEHFGAILVASDRDNPRLEHLLGHMEANPGTAVVDVGRLDMLREQTAPAAGASSSWDSLHVRVAHPALAALSTIAAALEYLGPIGGTVAALDPVSSMGKDAIALLARQAGHRIQGAPVEETIGDWVLAFNVVAVDDDDLNEEAALLLPSLEMSVTRSLSGCFHGHVAHVGLEFRDAVDEQELNEALAADGRIAVLGPPLGLDTIPESEHVAVTMPRLSRNGRHMAAIAMVDGLRIGGALTAIEVLRSIHETPS
jgi:hypothetical protein